MVDNQSDTGIYPRLKALLEKVLPKTVSVENVTPVTRLHEDLDIDSIRLVDLILYMEDEFGIQIEDGTIEGIKTIGDLLDLIKKKIG